MSRDFFLKFFHSLNKVIGGVHFQKCKHENAEKNCSKIYKNLHTHMLYYFNQRLIDSDEYYNRIRGFFEKLSRP